MINAIKQFIKDRALFKKAAQDLDNKDLQAKAKYAFEHRDDNVLSVIDCQEVRANSVVGNIILNGREIFWRKGINFLFFGKC